MIDGMVVYSGIIILFMSTTFYRATRYSNANNLYSSTSVRMNKEQKYCKKQILSLHGVFNSG